jgi:hypothetical protein
MRGLAGKGLQLDWEREDWNCGDGMLLGENKYETESFIGLVQLAHCGGW